jgi:hypothetical protein
MFFYNEKYLKLLNSEIFKIIIIILNKEMEYALFHNMIYFKMEWYMPYIIALNSF